MGEIRRGTCPFFHQRSFQTFCVCSAYPRRSSDKASLPFPSREGIEDFSLKSLRMRGDKSSRAPGFTPRGGELSPLAINKVYSFCQRASSLFSGFFLVFHGFFLKREF
jgi:hypothetical protein